MGLYEVLRQMSSEAINLKRVRQRDSTTTSPNEMEI